MSIFRVLKSPAPALLLLFCLLLLVGGITLAVLSEQDDATKAREFLQKCREVGGVPVYDLCAASGFEVIELPGYPYAPEVEKGYPVIKL